ncbi:hypothetical protein TSA1_29740 [Bradyrhizobium nitroreducens]|uniref:UDP-N-acetylmuramoyl-L-alanyl-D-glutamate--2,6-diaminopimelate ligase n=1 Tax=Bradyrhizobium nitroreducens TaxID=709803 RepID=A0A2M6UPA7_9BRAD|nr:hypothetical protein TSA1_29740 [Bradyrhizobium nitroreducens]
MRSRFGAEPVGDLSQFNEGLYLFGVTDDSRDVRFGYVFCAVRGEKQDGTKFCRQAAAKGAQAIAVQSGVPVSALGLNDYELTKIAILRVPDVRAFYARLCARFHPGLPDTMVGATGTNGKTSTVSFLRDLWDLNGKSAVSLGTLGIQSRSHARTNLEAGLTTFDAKTLHIMLSELKTVHGISNVAMEASSHALHQGRLAGLAFDAAIFTNLTLDHLDYHKDMDAYYVAKAMLFRERLKPDGTAIINVDDPRGAELAAELKASRRRVITYSRRSPASDLQLVNRKSRPAGQDLEVSIFGRVCSIALPLAGEFQADNIMAAMGAAIATGLTADHVVEQAAKVSPVPGRLELVATTPAGAPVYVDYAHTPDALENVLSSLRPHVPHTGRLHVVFGCGGDRDTSKRPKMGDIASRLADRAWITDDNPRSEEPTAIRKAIIAGGPACVDAGDRQSALRCAIEEAGGSDIVVVAGKGHEDYQILPVRNELGAPILDESGRFELEKVLFSDQDLIRSLCR